MSLTVTRILHAGYQFHTENCKILFDPILEVPFSVNCYAFPPVEFDLSQIPQNSWDAIFISHIHDDHFSLKSLNYFDRATPIYLFSRNLEAFDLLKKLGFKKVYPLNHFQTLRISDLEVTCYPALDIDIDCIFHIHSQGFNILNMVDSWVDYETLDKLCKIRKWNLVLWPFQTMRETDSLSPRVAPAPDIHIPSEWLDQLQQLNADAIVPSSCQFKFESDSWLNSFFFPISYQGFSDDLKNAKINSKVVRLDPGMSYELKTEELSENQLRWLKPLKSEDSDYLYLPHIEIPSLLQFSKGRFVIEDNDDQVFLRQWLCELDRHFLNTKNYLTEEGEELQFIWNFKVYSDGKVLWDKTFTKTSTDKTALPWNTEVLAGKLLNVLKNSESLSSLYLRINDSPGVERPLLHDVLQDPLLQILYTHDELAFQKNQLRKIPK